MKRFSFIYILFLLFYTTISSQQFGDRVDMGIIESAEIREASGIAASRKNPGIFWTHNDSGGEAKIFAFDSLGKHRGKFLLAGIQNRDWEDIAIGPGSNEGEQYLYIADIGDNSSQYDVKYIYRIIEPVLPDIQTPVDTVIYDIERLVFQYPDGNRNAESLMIDPLTLDIYIISKETTTKLYRAAYPYTFYSAPTLNVDTLEVLNSFTFSTVVASDISSDGREILIKKYNVLYYWYRNEGESIEETLSKDLTKVPYIVEPQGEAVCWASDLSGYYTLSESSHPHLYFYPRISTDVKSENNLPSVFSLEQNYPNPFGKAIPSGNPSTTIKYSIPTAVGDGHARSSTCVTLKIYDILGQDVATLVNKQQQPGNYEVQFDANNLPSGIYFYKINAGNFSTTRKMMLLK